MIDTDSTAWQLDEYRRKNRNTFKSQAKTTTHNDFPRPVESTFLRDYHEVERLAINSQRAETKICTVGTLLREDPRQYYSSTTKRSGEFSPGYHIVKSKDRKPRFNNNQEFFRAQVTCYKDDWIDYLRLVRRITRQS